MRLTVFGGTGPTGRLLIEQALTEGHTVTAFARTPAKLPAHERVQAIKGTLDDAGKISEAVKGSDAVLSLLGPSTKPADALQLASGYRHIIGAMQAHGVDRLVVTGTSIISAPGDGRNARITSMVTLLRLLQKPTYNAIRGMGDLVRGSGLAWTIVRLPFLSDGPATETVNAGPLGKRGSLRLSRANAAAFILAQATDAGRIHQAPFVTEN